MFFAYSSFFSFTGSLFHCFLFSWFIPAHFPLFLFLFLSLVFLFIFVSFIFFHFFLYISLIHITTLLSSFLSSFTFCHSYSTSSSFRLSFVIAFPFLSLSCHIHFPSPFLQLGALVFFSAFLSVPFLSYHYDCCSPHFNFLSSSSFAAFLLLLHRLSPSSLYPLIPTLEASEHAHYMLSLPRHNISLFPHMLAHLHIHRPR